MEKRKSRAKLFIVLGAAFLVLAGLLALFSGVIYDLFVFDGSGAVPSVNLTLEDLIEREDGSYEVRFEVDFRSTRKLEGLTVQNIRLYTDPEEGKGRGKQVKWMYRARVVSTLPTGWVPRKFKIAFVTDPLESESPTFDFLFGLHASARLGGIFKGGMNFGTSTGMQIDRSKASRGSDGDSGD
ncbi:MAG: hypothetical protein ACYTFG_15850 [Planctomycetota bacterium]|jgi:hypothetical protein